MKVSTESLVTLRSVVDTLECDVTPIWVRTAADVLETLARQLKSESTTALDPRQTLLPLP